MYKKIVSKILGEAKDTKLLHELMKVPQKETGDNMPRYNNDFIANYTHQADLLHLPQDRFGLKYALVVVDDATRKVDAEPIKSKDSSTVAKAFQKIYNRGILSIPKVVELDSGSEFHGSTEIWFKSKDIRVRYAETNRHRQEALVETANHRLGKILYLIMNQKELETGKPTKEWTKYLPDVIESINEHIADRRPKKLSSEEKEEKKYPIATKENKKLLPIGTNVRVALDHPEDVATGKRLSGKFRASDIRWSRDIYQITNISLKPDSPPLYDINDRTGIQRTLQQLQVVQSHFV